MSRTKRGYLEINEKKYLIYDGLNLIGRNREATVVIADASVSRHHCAVAVIDDRHFISDTNSSNGTYLEDIKLSPLQLHELNIDSNIKIGLVNVKYFKVIGDVDTLFENEKNECIPVESEIFEATTQIYNIVDKPSTNNTSTKRDTMPESEVRKAVTFNDLPTQIAYTSDECINDCAEKEESPSGDSKKDMISFQKASINDLPTQIIGDAVDCENTLEAVNPSFNQSSVVIEESLIDEAVVQEATNENSKDSTDFLTMQPALSQYNFNETQSQLYVDLLQKRVRNVIGSSSDDDSNCEVNCGLRTKGTKHLSAESSDDETDIETSFVRRKMLRKNKRPVIDSDGNGDSTDAEEMSKLNVTILKKVSLSKDDVGSNSDDTDVGYQLNEITMTTNANSKIGNDETGLNDSDMIPVTQENANTEPNVVPNKVSQGTSLESSLADSFHLLLTNSDRIRTEDENDRNSKSTTGDGNTIAEESKQLNDVQHSQSELSFDDQDLSREKLDDNRPLNPPVNVFENVENSEVIVTGNVPSNDVVETSTSCDVIEDKLLEIFKPTQEVQEENVDDVYAESTQILPNCSSGVGKDIFDVATQVVTVNASEGQMQDDENSEVGISSNQHTFLCPTSLPKKKATRTPADDDDGGKRSISGISECEKDVTDNIFQRPTQKITTDSHESNITEVDENIFLQSTQILEVATQNTTGPDRCTTGKQDRNVQDAQPMEKIAGNGEIANLNDISTDDSDHIETNGVRGTSFEEDDLFVQSTQILDVENRNVTEGGLDKVKESQCSPTKQNSIGSDQENVIKLTTALTRHVEVLSVTEINEKADKTESMENAHEKRATFADDISVNGAKTRQDNIDGVVQEAPKVQDIDNLQAETAFSKRRKLENGEKKNAEVCQTPSKKRKRNFDDRENSSLKQSKGKHSPGEIDGTSSKTSRMQDEAKLMGDATPVLRHETGKSREDSATNSEDEFQITPIKKQEKQRGTTLAIKGGSTKSADNRRNTKLKRKSSTLKEESDCVREDNSDYKTNEKRISTTRKKNEENSVTTITSNLDSNTESVDQRRSGRKLRKSNRTSSNSSGIGDVADVTDRVKTRKSTIVQEQTKRYNVNGGEKSLNIANTIANSSGPSSDSVIKGGRTRRTKIVQKESEVFDTNNTEKSHTSNIMNDNVTDGARTRKSKTTEKETRQDSDMESSGSVSSSIRRTGNVTGGDANGTITKKSRGRTQKKTKTQNNEVSISEEMVRDDNDRRSVRSDTRNVDITNAQDKVKKRKIKDRIETKHVSGEDELPSTSEGADNTADGSNNNKKNKKSNGTSEKLYNFEEKLVSSVSSDDAVDDRTRNKVQKGGQMETKNTIQKSPERNKRKLKPKIVFTMLDSPELETIIRSLGGFVVDSVEGSTILLTASVKRSQKFLTAVAQAKPICSPKWLHHCKKANMFLDPWEYILEDEEAEKKWNFSLRESLKRSSTCKLLHNYTFQIMVNTAQDVLKGSIEACGGKCVSRAPSKNAFLNFVIVASPDNRSKYVRFLKQNPKPRIVLPEAIFDGILRQELHFEDHLLS